MTHERELLTPVDLCDPEGLRLNPQALGWSRAPLHRANLDGEFGRNKRWDYWAVLAGDLVFSCVYADVDHIGLADVYWVDLTTGAHGGQSLVAPREADIRLPELPGTAPLRIAHDGLELNITDDEIGTRIHAMWKEADGRPGAVDVMVALPKGHESLNVVIPWSDELFNFTSKHQARPAHGELRVGSQTWDIGENTPDGAWGVLDVGRGRWPSKISWNWGGGAGYCGDHVVGIQIGAKWTEGSGFTENGTIVDGRLTKLGNELEWDYDWDEPMRPWRVRDPGGQLDITLTPRFDKVTSTGGADLGSDVHQVFGTWSGEMTTDDGTRLTFERIQGFAEEARQRW